MKKHVNKIRLAVLVLAVMAMVLGVSMTVSASTTQTVTKAGYLRDEPNRGGIALVRIPKGATVTVGISQGKYSRVIYKRSSNTFAGWFYTAYLSGSGTEVYRTISDAVNLRTGPSVNYRLIMTIPAGARVEVLGTKNTWYKVIYSGRTGYISPGHFAGDTSIRYTKTAAYFRSSPYMDPKNRNVITTIPANRAVTIIREANSSWYYAEYNGRRGYIGKKVLK
jgi:uncharacterized protein YgiM (DUF1202 family)